MTHAKLTLLAGSFLVIIGAGVALAQKPAEPVVKDGLHVVGVSVIQADPTSKIGGSLVMGQQPGTRVYFMLTNKDQFFVSVDDNAGKIESFQDDQGTDLRKGQMGSGFGPFPKLSEDGKSCMFEVACEKVPASGAASLSITGHAVVTVGLDAKTAEQADVELKKDTKLSIGGLQAVVDSAEIHKFSDTPSLEITLKNDKGFDAIKSIYIVGTDGKAIKGEYRGYSNIGATFSRSYSFKTNSAKGKLGVVYFEKLQKQEVPIDVKVTLGL
ncbi:MAG: hypothetical protein EHM48_10030 [Planctomycetaceae bacterium]|nr:MAG: hypothetical protein EHM48_10030 [Planctomycetaceae bacterium]